MSCVHTTAGTSQCGIIGVVECLVAANTSKGAGVVCFTPTHPKCISVTLCQCVQSCAQDCSGCGSENFGCSIFGLVQTLHEWVGSWASILHLPRNHSFWLSVGAGHKNSRSNRRPDGYSSFATGYSDLEVQMGPSIQLWPTCATAVPTPQCTLKYWSCGLAISGQKSQRKLSKCCLELVEILSRWLPKHCHCCISLRVLMGHFILMSWLIGRNDPCQHVTHRQRSVAARCSEREENSLPPTACFGDLLCLWEDLDHKAISGQKSQRKLSKCCLELVEILSRWLPKHCHCCISSRVLTGHCGFLVQVGVFACTKGVRTLSTAPKQLINIDVSLVKFLSWQIVVYVCNWSVHGRIWWCADGQGTCKNPNQVAENWKQNVVKSHASGFLKLIWVVSAEHL